VGVFPAVIASDFHQCRTVVNISVVSICDFTKNSVLCQTFDELMELASNGTDRSVNEYTSDVNYASNAVDNDDSSYVAMAQHLQDTPLLLFSFGKAVGSKRGGSLLLILSRPTCIQCESKKIPPPRNFLTFFPNGWEFLVQILHAYYMFLCTLD